MSRRYVTVEVHVGDVLHSLGVDDVVGHFDVNDLHEAVHRKLDVKKAVDPLDLLDAVEAEVRLRAARQPDRLDSALRDLRAALQGKDVSGG